MYSPEMSVSSGKSSGRDKDSAEFLSKLRDSFHIDCSLLYYCTMKFSRGAVTLLGVVVPAIYIAMVYSSLPLLIPSHFGLDGYPNRFGPKAILWFILGASASLYILLTVVSRLPRLFNLPGPRGGVGRLYLEGLGIQLLAWIKLELVLTFAYTLWRIVKIANRRAVGLGVGFILVAFISMMSTIVYYLVRMRRIV